MNDDDPSNWSHLTLYGQFDRGECGYCHKETALSCSYGFESERMRIEDYDYLMNRGFRRSGTYFYKPTMYKTCCPQYTIRLNVTNFYLTKSQKNTLKKVLKSITSSRDLPSTIQPSSGFTVETVPAEFTVERYELYRKYQIQVHHDKPEDITEKSFTRFLIESPLTPKCHPMSVEDCALPSLPTPTEFFHPISDSSPNSVGRYSGTYHQLYRLNGILIAVSVLDILPTGVSSVYCFYDPDHRHLELGKYTALYEIAFTHHLRLPFYYMGFYIHGCQKMAYKAEYHPTEVLCPVTFRWYELNDTIKEYMSQHKFIPLDPHVRELYLHDKNNPQSYLPTVLDRSAINPKRCQFFLGEYRRGIRLLRSEHLTEEGRKIVEQILEEFLLLSDQSAGERFLYRFN